MCNLDDTLQIRLSSDLKDRIIDYSIDNEVNISKLIRDFLEETLKEEELKKAGYKTYTVLFKKKK